MRPLDGTERRRGDRRKSTRLIAQEPGAIQRDWIRRVLLVLVGRGLSKLLELLDRLTALKSREALMRVIEGT